MENKPELPGTEKTIIETDFETVTEVREPAPVNNGPATVTDADFIELPKPAPEKTVAPNKETVTAEPVTTRIKVSAKDSAETGVFIIDGATVLAFGLINKKKKQKYFGSRIREVEQLFNEINDGRKEKKGLTDEEYKDYLSMKKFMDIEKDIPLTSEETDQLTEALEKYLKSKPDYDIPPGFALGFAALSIFTPRIVDAFDKP